MLDTPFRPPRRCNARFSCVRKREAMGTGSERRPLNLLR